MNRKSIDVRPALAIPLFALIFLVTGLSALGQPIPTNTPSPSLDTWGFNDTNTWKTDRGYLPISFTNLGVSFIGDGTSLVVDSTNAAWLQYNIFETNGTTNLVVGSEGSLVFWFAPNWASVSQGGSGPGVFGRMIEVGYYTSDASYGWWSLYVDDAGSNVYFSAQTNNGTQTNYLSVPIAWTTNYWHFLALNYSPTNTELVIDATNIATGPGVTIYPNLSVQSNGFCIGSDGLATGLLQSHGNFDDFGTYNCQLDTNTISRMYSDMSIYYLMNPADAANISQAPSEPETAPAFDAVTGQGYLQAISTNFSDCVTSNDVWITNAEAALVGTNMSLTFTIAGGSNGVPYDVFANSIFAIGTNYGENAAWAWMGQGYLCVTYTLTNLPTGTCFLVLGTPQDSYNNGLTDAYEWLVLRKNPADPSGDGIMDGWKVLWGMNPAINNSAQPGERANYTYDGTGRLEALFGINAEVFNFDSEGNIKLDEQ